MDFAKNLRELLWTRIGPEKPYANRKRMADALGVDPSQLNRFMDGERGLAVDTLGRILDGLGARITLPDDKDPEAQSEAPREVCFVSPRPGAAAQAAPRAQDYMAVPMATKALAAADSLGEAEIQGWALVWRHHECVRFRSDLVAVALGEEDSALAPALLPGDVVLLDRAEKSPDPAGKIMLVRQPEAAGGSCLLRRVAARTVEDDLELVFYGEDNMRTPPLVQRLNRDYGGDLAKAVVGRVVWAWSDMTRK